MSEWKKVKFFSLFSEPTKNGIYKTKEFHGKGAKIINMGEVFAYSFLGNQEMNRVDINDKERASFLVKNGDLLFARRSLIESGAGKCSIVTNIEEETTFESSIIRVRLNEKVAMPLYYMYWMRSLAGRTAVNGIVNGVNVKGIRATDLQNIEVDCPPLHIQQRIATILSRYDTLIENYQKQIKLLEEAAQRLYKECFVDLRFPGHENSKIVDGVPEGWEKKMVGDLLCMHMNGGWGKDSSTGSNVIQAPVIRGTDIDKIKGGFFDDLPIRFHTEKDIYNKHLEVNDIILELSNGNINNVGRTLRIDDNLLKQYGKHVICASFCKFLRPIDYRISIILFSEFQDMQNGSRMQKFKKNGANGINNFDFQEFLKHVVIVPPVSFTIKELEIIQKSISDYRVQIRLLIEARDRLLPKLMNGEISAIGEMA